MMGPITTPKDVTVPVVVVEREQRFDLLVDGRRYTPKVLSVPLAIVDCEESFNRMANGARYDTKICLGFRGGCRGQSEL
ncbi:hypothetical protein L484_000103 [Morus notabilis]|uniref:Uncharacterized protein n=1 Tax=Morus notabilis TaxID=981085 RepID=W9R349_9ROSA|nr:hypothetical protein L484_000103 [Morus notabilis]